MYDRDHSVLVPLLTHGLSNADFFSRYRMDVQQDGTGIETAGWFRSSGDVTERSDETMVTSRLCALQWVITLYECVVPDVLKADVSFMSLSGSSN
jgi:hypothetical protein